MWGRRPIASSSVLANEGGPAMTAQPRTRAWSTIVVGVMALACAVNAQSGDESLIRRVVARPSSEFTTYIEGELVRVNIPSNWRELPGSNAVTFAPEGAYGNAGVKSVFTHGLAMGLARNDKHNLRKTTDDFLVSSVLVSMSPGRAFRYRHVTIGDRRGLHTALSRLSEATGEPERIELYTTLLRDGTLFYVLAVAPRECVSDYEATFRRVIGSIEIIDGDRRVP
jgi:hypothetical protein